MRAELRWLGGFPFVAQSPAGKAFLRSRVAFEHGRDAWLAEGRESPVTIREGVVLAFGAFLPKVDDDRVFRFALRTQVEEDRAHRRRGGFWSALGEPYVDFDDPGFVWSADRYLELTNSALALMFWRAIAFGGFIWNAFVWESVELDLVILLKGWCANFGLLFFGLFIAAILVAGGSLTGAAILLTLSGLSMAICLWLERWAEDAQERAKPRAARIV